mmetsp:Transcript_65249/g.153635  ORF Transcript_65249/g.153635 Transcript_65249/m.153635 type:complete len:545 (+) Transcript_65249:99-1733(+)
MASKPKSLALSKFQQAGLATIDKIKKDKSEAKPSNKGFDVVQIGSLLFVAWMVLWIIAASVVSFVFTVRYMGIVEEDQAWYLLNGRARSAVAETTAVLNAAVEAKEALISSINLGLISTSYDYAAIESTLVPTMLLKPYLRSFEITFSDRVAGLAIHHQAEEGGRQLVLQSNAQDCYLLGTQGCADFGVPQQRFPGWHTEAMFLNMSFEGADSEIISQQQMVQISKQAGPAQQWYTTPTLVAGTTRLLAQNTSVAWYPVIRLFFRQPLPEAWASQKEILCGRISVEVMTLGGDRMRDVHLGENGRTYVVDSFGMVLSALDIEDTIMAHSLTGELQFRRVFELPDTDFGSLVAGAFKGDRIDAMQVQEGSLSAVVQPLGSPFEMFAVVVVSRLENTSFQDTSIIESMSVLIAFASLPYVIVIVTMTIVLISANSGIQFDRSVLARMTGAATSLAGRKRRSNVVRRSSQGPLFDQEMLGVGNKVSLKSVVMGDDWIYDDDGKPKPVQHRKTHIMNDAYFAASKSKGAWVIRCMRCLCCCCLGRQAD